MDQDTSIPTGAADTTDITDFYRSGQAMKAVADQVFDLPFAEKLLSGWDVTQRYDYIKEEGPDAQCTFRTDQRSAEIVLSVHPKPVELIPELVLHEYLHVVLADLDMQMSKMLQETVPVSAQGSFLRILSDEIEKVAYRVSQAIWMAYQIPYDANILSGVDGSGSLSPNSDTLEEK